MTTPRQLAAEEGFALTTADGFRVVHDYRHQVSFAENGIVDLSCDGEGHEYRIFDAIADALIEAEDRAAARLTEEQAA